MVCFDSCYPYVRNAQMHHPRSKVTVSATKPGPVLCQAPSTALTSVSPTLARARKRALPASPFGTSDTAADSGPLRRCVSRFRPLRVYTKDVTQSRRVMLMHQSGHAGAAELPVGRSRLASMCQQPMGQCQPQPPPPPQMRTHEMRLIGSQRRLLLAKRLAVQPGKKDCC